MYKTKIISEQKTKSALLIILLGGLFFIAGSSLEISMDNKNVGAWMALIGGVPLTFFAVLGLSNKSLFNYLSKRDVKC